MPPSSPVNNALTVELATLNDALCTLCGVLDAGNHGELLRFCYKGPFARAKLDERTPLVDAFSHYYERLARLPHDPTQTLPRQIAGIMAFLRSLENLDIRYVVTQHGTTNAPLTIREAEATMLAQPEDTRCATMLGAWSPHASRFTDSHWLLAVKTGDAIRYTDYQLDLAEPVRAEVAARERVTVPLDAPLVSAVPTRAFGRPTQPDDRVVLLACRKA
jgi:hypothetical protein